MCAARGLFVDIELAYWTGWDGMDTMVVGLCLSFRVGWLDGWVACMCMCGRRRKRRRRHMRFPLVFISCAERSGADGPCDGGVDFEDRVLLDWMGEGEGVGVMCCVVLCCFVVMDTRCLSCLLFISSSLLDTWSRFFFFITCVSGRKRRTGPGC